MYYICMLPLLVRVDNNKQQPSCCFFVLQTPRATWSARTWLSFVSQRLSVATQLAAAQEVAEALGLSVAADPRLQ